MGAHERRRDAPRSAGLTRRRVALAVVAVLALVWVALGVRQLEPDREFGVLDHPFGSTRVRSGWALAPPGLARLTRYPAAAELALPGADQLDLTDDRGVRYGFRGWVTVRSRPDGWQPLHAAAAGRGLHGVLVEAVRVAAGELDPVLVRGLGADALADALEPAITRALAERGVDLRRLDLDAIDRLRAEGPGEDPGSKVLVLGLDGADWEILNPLLEAGRMPNLKRLVDGGVSGKLLTISPMLSPVIWTTIATGVEPSRHGILDFLVADASGENRQPVTSAQRTAATLWQILGRAGIECGVVGWWATWPADPVHGYLVADRLAYQLFDYRADPDDAEGKTWPPELYDDVRPRITPPDSVPWSRVEPYLSGDRRDPEAFDATETELLDEFRTLLASGDTYIGVADALRRERRPRFEAVYLEGTDTIGHLFMRFRAPRLPGVTDRSFASFRDVVDRYYETADAEIGRLLEDRGDDWTILVVSDHGFASDATRPHSTDSRIGHGAAASWHRRFGVIVLAGRHIAEARKIDEASVYDIAPTILTLFGQPVPSSWPGRVLTSALDPGFLARYPVRFRADDPPRRSAEGAILATGAGGQVSDELMRKLESLGYISAGGAASESVTARNNAGVALMAEGKFADAEREFRAGLEQFPRQAMLRVNLGLALRRQGRTDDAAVEFEQALGAPDAARAAGLQLAQIALADGELRRAEGYLRTVLEREPDAPEVLTTLGEVLERRGEPAEAGKLFRRAAEVDPNAADPRNRLGNLARGARRADEAERWYLAAIEADPFFMGAYNNLALVYQDQGRLQDAIDLYGRALEKSPGNAVVINNLASLYYARGELDEAARLWRRAIQILPGYPSPYNNLAGIEIARARWTEAETLLRRAIGLEPGYGDARVNLAIVHRARREHDEAEGELRRAVEDPRSAGQAWFQWGLLDLDRGAWTDAVGRLERARPLLGDRPAVLNLLGEAYHASGRPSDARAVWQRSIEVAPDQPAVLERLARVGAGAPSGPGVQQ